VENDDLIDGLMTDEPETAPAVEAQEVAPVEAEAPAPVVEQAPPEKPEPGHVPLTALMDERDKRKALEARLAEYERNQAQIRAMPDPNLDPNGYQQHLLQQTQQMVIDTRLNMSEVAARRHYGAETTDAAKQWALERFQQSPAFQAEVLGQPDPYDYAIQAYQREQIASQVTPDAFKEFQAWKAAQAQVAAAPVVAPTPSAPIPKSIASVASAGGVGHMPIDPVSDFVSAF
jgi:hypothetical protein